MRAGWSGTCPSCGKRSYTSRAKARQARDNAHQGHMTAYKCQQSGQWHVGHMPADVLAGQLDKDEYLARRFPVVACGGIMAVTVTFADPRDPARLVDALLVAADAARRTGHETLARRYVTLSNQLADAVDLSDCPPYAEPLAASS